MHIRRAHRVLAAAVILTPVAFAAPPTDAERLDRLSGGIESAMAEQHIPGLAIAVVQDGEVVFIRGFGLADMEGERPVTPDTLFAIGSTTKAFTATIIGSLVDEGKMSWDDQVTKYLPDFAPPVDGEGLILLRDMLCHRTGFTRMSMAWAGGKASREEILSAATNAEPWAPFREQFLYNNVMFMAAGMSAGIAAGSDWETLVRTRIFDPLGMNDASLTMAEVEHDERLALGYKWEDDAFKRAPMRNIDMIGPAGSINANATDMAKWVGLLLDGGVTGGHTIISGPSLEETWTEQIEVGGGIGYGLGWMLREWNGQRVVEHGGNIDGFSAEVALLPESNIGFVLLMNTGYAPLQAGSIDMVFDALLGGWGDGRDVAVEPDGLAEIEGVYIANYAHFKDEHFTVALNDDGKLTIDIPSQMKFTLDEPGEDGRRPFKGFPQIAASFERAADGSVTLLRLYQGGLKFDVPREGYTFPIEVPLKELKAYTGKYSFVEKNDEPEVMIRNNHLAVDVPGQMTFELSPPDEEGKWAFRANDVLEIAVSFQKDDFGNVESMTMFQGGQEFVMPRIPDADEAATDLPTVDEVAALARLDERQAAIDKAAKIRLLGAARFAQSGVKGTAEITLDGGRRFRADVDLGVFGSLSNSVDGEHGWANNSISPFERLDGRKLESARLDNPNFFLGDWRECLDGVRVTGRAEIDGRAVIVVEGTPGELPKMTLSIDAETGDILRIDKMMDLPEFPGLKLPVTTDLRDWREVSGIRVPHELVTKTEQNGRFILRLSEVKTGVTVPDGFFTLTRP